MPTVHSHSISVSPPHPPAVVMWAVPALTPSFPEQYNIPDPIQCESFSPHHCVINTSPLPSPLPQFQVQNSSFVSYLLSDQISLQLDVSTINIFCSVSALNQCNTSKPCNKRYAGFQVSRINEDLWPLKISSQA